MGNLNIKNIYKRTDRQIHAAKHNLPRGGNEIYFAICHAKNYG